LRSGPACPYPGEPVYRAVRKSPQVPGVNGPVLAYACGSEAQAVARMDNLINGLVREHARAAALQLELDFLPGLCLMPRLGLGLRF
jgi:hypothetical protein